MLLDERAGRMKKFFISNKGRILSHDTVPSRRVFFSLEFTVRKAGLGGEKRKISFTLGSSREGIITTTGIITKVRN
jgi:hypothetical protein